MKDEMKLNRSTTMLLELFPYLKTYLVNDKAAIPQDLSKEEEVFVKLARFTSNPNQHGFDVQEIYLHLDSDKIALFFEVLSVFFEHDTYLKQSLPLQILREEDPLVNQTGFSRLVSRVDPSFVVAKVHTYHKRGLLPKADVEIEGKPYWKTSTVTEYIFSIHSS